MKQKHSKDFTKEEKIFLKGCFEKMGISSKDAQEMVKHIYDQENATER